MRIGEVLSLEWLWINQVNKIINLPTEATKSNKSREIPISPALMKLFTNLPKNSNLVFPAKTGDKRKSIKTAFNNAVRRAGLKNVTTHVLRKTRATIWASKDDQASKKAIGHSSDKIHYGHYVKITEERLYRLVV